MNAPPDVPPRRKRVPDWLREALFIVASIALYRRHLPAVRAAAAE